MPLKAHLTFLPDEVCNFCKLKVTGVLYGPIYKSKQKYAGRPIVVHYFCLLMASKIQQNGTDNQGILGFFPKDIINELERGRDLICVFCNGNGATVQCIHSGCDKTFHLPCGVLKGSIHRFYDSFDSFCPAHKPKQKIPASVLKEKDMICPLCSSDVDTSNRNNIVWPTCCSPKVMIHRECMQTHANSAGYYFKCPMCLNKEIFKKEMQKIGIYVPDQEASWESEPNAYSELLVRGSGCEAEKCVCPKGNKYNRKNTIWQIELCKVCGGNGVHLGCTDRWNKTQGYELMNWFCQVCKPVYLENKSSTTPERELETVENNNGITSPANETLNKEDEDEDIIVVSEDELPCETNRLQDKQFDHQPNNVTDQEIKPIIQNHINNDIVQQTSSISYQRLNILPDQQEIKISPNKLIKCTSEKENVINKPVPPVINLENSQPNQDSSDDDCQIVGVIELSGKRRRHDNGSRKRRFRLPWALSNETLDRNSERKIEEPLKISEDNQKHSQFSFSVSSINNGIQNLAESSSTQTKVGNMVPPPIVHPVQPRKVSTFEANNIKTKLLMKYNEVTFNKVTSRCGISNNLSPEIKEKLNSSNVQISTVTQIIDLSSDEEEDRVQPNRVNSVKDSQSHLPSVKTSPLSKSTLDEGSESFLSKLLAKDPLHTAHPNSSKKLDVWVESQIISSVNRKPNNSYCKNELLSKALESNLSYSVILSSGDEDETEDQSLESSNSSSLVIHNPATVSKNYSSMINSSFHKRKSNSICSPSASQQSSSGSPTFQLSNLEESNVKITLPLKTVLLPERNIPSKENAETSNNKSVKIEGIASQLVPFIKENFNTPLIDSTPSISSHPKEGNTLGFISSCVSLPPNYFDFEDDSEENQVLFQSSSENIKHTSNNEEVELLPSRNPLENSTSNDAFLNMSSLQDNILTEVNTKSLPEDDKEISLVDSSTDKIPLNDIRLVNKLSNIDNEVEPVSSTTSPPMIIESDDISSMTSET